MLIIKIKALFILVKNIQEVILINIILNKQYGKQKYRTYKLLNLF